MSIIGPPERPVAPRIQTPTSAYRQIEPPERAPRPSAALAVSPYSART